MKRILASVFMVLAVVAAVGIFGVQTSDRTEATTAFDMTVNAGGGVANITNAAVGRSYTIDLSQFVTTTGSASPTYHIITQTGYFYDADALAATPGFNGGTDKWIPSATTNDKLTLHDAFRTHSRCAVSTTATPCAAADAPALFISLDEDTGLLTITPNPTGRASGAWGNAQIHWAADSTPGNNGGAGVTTAVTATAIDTLVAATFNVSNADSFQFTAVAAPTSGVTPARSGSAPATGPATGFFPTDGDEDPDGDFDATPAWRGDALTRTALGSDASSTAAPESSLLRWELGALPTAPAAYELAVHSSDTTVATVQAGTSARGYTDPNPDVDTTTTSVVITPVSPGTTTITVDVIPTAFAVGSSYAARTATTDKWRITREVTVTYATEAPPIEIYHDPNGNGKDSDDPKGNSEADPISISTTSGSAGEIAQFHTDSTATATYQNRDVKWRLARANGANVLRNFTMDTGDLTNIRVGTDLGDDNQAGGTGDDADTPIYAQTSTGILSIAPGVTLPVGSTHTIQVIAEDFVRSSTSTGVGGGNVDNAYVTVRILQGNRSPVLQDLGNVVIPETTAVGGALLDLDNFASDPDSQRLTFRLFEKAGADPAEDLGDKVTLHPDTNEIRLAELVDYEDLDDDGETEDEDTLAEQTAWPTTYDRNAVRWRGTVSVTDGILTVEKKITFTVSDGTEAPTTGQVALEFDLPEDAVLNDIVGVIGRTGETWTDFSFNNTFGADNDYFKIVNGAELTALGKEKPTGVTDATQGILLVGVLNDDGSDNDDDSDDRVVEFNFESDKTVFNIAIGATATSDAPTPLDRGSAVRISITNVDEAPHFTKVTSATDSTLIRDDATTALPQLVVDETALVGDPVGTAPNDGTAVTAAPITAADEDAGESPVFSLVTSVTDATAYSGPFAISASTGQITVTGALDFETTPTHSFAVQIADADDSTLDPVRRPLTIRVRGAEEPPVFVQPAVLHRVIDETTATTTPIGTVIATYTATDGDNDVKVFAIRDADDAAFFEMDSTPARGILKTKAALDFEDPNYPDGGFAVEIKVEDAAGLTDELRVVIELNNLNDNAPVWQAGFSPTSLNVNENTLRDTPIQDGVYRATDADGDTVTYTLSGPNGAHYQIGSADGILKTLASLDADTNTTDSITVTASDGLASNNITRDTRITINDVNDRIGSITVKMANPVLGTNGDPNSALADRKRTESLAAPEAPTDLPATSGDTVVNFVQTAAAAWGTVIRIEVLAESPDANCGNANQCVVIELEGDDSDDILKVMAYRNNAKDNLFVAAVMPVASANMATPDATRGSGAVYRHTDGSVPRIKVDEEDTLRIKFGNLRDDVVIDNEAPEFANFLPEHEASTDDDEVDYTFTVTDAISGIPEPEDLPDADGDDAYMAVAALVNSRQCHNVAQGATPPAGTSMVANTNLHEGAQIYCPTGTTPEVRVIVDDKDLDSATDGYDVDTKVVLNQNEISFVTFIACDAAGNCTAFDPDENDTKEALAEITVDTADPTLSEARTGVMWDAADNAYDDSRTFIQAIFNDLSKLNPDTIEADDFVVDGYTIKRVYWYDDPDAGDQNWGTRYDSGSRARTYQAISKTVFIELEEELLPDATPDVSVVPNGIEDAAGNEQDDDEVEADDWIAPEFTVTDISSPRTTPRDNVLVGEDEKVTITVTSDERISTTKPLVDVNAVNAPDGCVDRSGVILRAGRDTDGDGRVEPSEARNDCAVSAKGTPINSVISKDGTNEWTITVDKPTQTGYYNVYIYADDRSSQNNRGSEGVAPDSIVTDFFEKDGDVNSDDAVFFEGDVQLPKPQVVVSGEQAGDTEPTVEFKRPLFVEVDFTEPFSVDCSDSDKLSNKIECLSESAEYAEDGFDTVTVTRFELDGVDMTDDVKTTDDKTFLVALDDVSIGDHEIKIQARDLAGNDLTDVLEIEFEVEERDPFTRRLNPGWNLVSLPGSPEDSAIASVFGSDIEVRTVYTYNPVTPGGWQVAVREELDDAWQGDLTDITAKSGYWVLSDAIQDLEVSIPRLAGGAVGASTPVQPPVIPMYAGWNLIPVVDVTGDALDTDKAIDATTYLNSLDDGLDLARVLGFNTITNEWFTVIDPSDTTVTDDLQIGSAYWVFVRESASLVPGGIPR